ncbi:MAG: class I SAM-dependent methyltransferase [Burkholderiales bacterium]|jgi:SAM-dependent methyltransferase
MSNGTTVIDWNSWLQTPAGQYVLEWEQTHLDAVVVNIFGFHAIQLGLPELQGLRANRMPHRWQAADCPHEHVTIQCHFDALPFESQSLDLVVLPHTLESVSDPRDALREVDRVLMPEGRLVITGFNPASFWGVRHQSGRLRQRLAPRSVPNFLPAHSDLIAQRRLRDWFHLLNFEVEGGQFGCYRPPFNRQQWLQHFEWMEAAGDRWWPMFGSVYLLVAVKRVLGLRLVGLAKHANAKHQGAPATAIMSPSQPTYSSAPTFHDE